MIQLHTERFLISDLTLDDFTEHHTLLSDERVMRYLQDIKTSSISESKENLIKAVEESLSSNRKLYFLKIEDKNSKEFIGEIGYTVIEETPFGKMVHLGYFIKEKYWGKGYTTEALQRIIEFAFCENNVYRISTGCVKENAGSEKVMQKCGFTKEGELKEHTFHEGKLKDRVIYHLLKSEFARQRV